MKKFVCLLMVIMMILALGIAVYAHYEPCPDCGGRLSTDTETERYFERCSECGSRYLVIETWFIESCDSCGVIVGETLMDSEGTCDCVMK